MGRSSTLMLGTVDLEALLFDPISTRLAAREGSVHGNFLFPLLVNVAIYSRNTRKHKTPQTFHYLGNVLMFHGLDFFVLQTTRNTT
jgi:hypothetical protein